MDLFSDSNHPTVKDRFKDPAYMNWQRACQSLVILKEYLEGFIDDRTEALHRYICCFTGGEPAPQCNLNHTASDIVREVRQLLCFSDNDILNVLWYAVDYV